MIHKINLLEKIEVLSGCYRDTLPLLVKNMSSSVLFSGLSRAEQEEMVEYLQNLSVVIKKHQDELNQLKKDIAEEPSNVY